MERRLSQRTPLDREGTGEGLAEREAHWAEQAAFLKNEPPY
ncbi:hypothetical protein QLQ09_24525 [Brucella sp. NM4]|nr:hypothetical protein [Brucella sp. NM4]WHS33891.1 hypothetical protein QLQ09_24525 [Brucella sp. NM4]